MMWYVKFGQILSVYTFQSAKAKIPKTAAPAPTSALALERAEAPEEAEGEDTAAVVEDARVVETGAAELAGLAAEDAALVPALVVAAADEVGAAAAEEDAAAPPVVVNEAVKLNLYAEQMAWAKTSACWKSAAEQAL